MIALILVAVAWGILPIVLRYAAMYAPPNVIIFVMSFCFFASACIYNLIYYPGNLISNLGDTSTGVLILLACIALLSVFGANLLYIMFLSADINTAVATLTISSLVSLIILLTFDKHMEVALKTLIGIALVTIGVAALAI